MSALEGGVGAIACASGHAAQLTAFHNLLQEGDEFIAAKKLYGGLLINLKTLLNNMVGMLNLLILII